ncbi:FlgD immunoglobulin-like domain containing protein [Streptomyces tauricus]|uniref:FlgD immunoglobulin-like domain containing protein n=1 Tax=Streptomyces tauricus TaxID=68274 RepID=UPI0033B68CF5
MIRSRRLAGLALGGALALSGTVLTGPAQAAPNADTPVATTQLNQVKPTEVRLRWAGASGFQYEIGWLSNPLWAEFPGVTPPGHAGPDELATGTDVVLTSRSGSTVGQKHRSTGVTATVTIPAGQTYRGMSGWSVLTQDAEGALHVLRATTDGATADLPVTGLPSGAQPSAYTTGGSVRRLAVTYTLDGVTSVGLVDLADGTFRAYVEGSGGTPDVHFNDSWVLVDRKAVRVDSAPGTEPAAVSFRYKPLAVVGDQVLSGHPEFTSSDADLALTAVSLTTGARRTVLDHADGTAVATQDGGLLVDAGKLSTDRHVYRVLPTGDGDVSAQPVFTVPAGRAQVDGLALAGGELLMFGSAVPVGWDAMYAVPLDTRGKPTGDQERRSPYVASSPCLGGDAACPQLEALGDGRFAYLFTGTDGKESVHVAGLGTDTSSAEPTGDSGGRIGTGTGRYVLYNGGSAGVQKVADFPRGADGGTALNRTRGAAAVWGQRLWTPGTTQGSVVGYDLKSQRNVATVATGAPCAPSEIQAVNTWLYWTCGTAGPAGVYDRATGRSVTVPAGSARLADGYLVRENRTTHELQLTDFRTGTATTRTVAVLPTADQNTGGHTGRWAVDRFGGNIAYLTADGRVALVTAGVPTSPLAVMETQAEPQAGPTIANPWQPVWQLSKPSTWTLTLSNSSGTTVRTLTGASTAAAVRPSWNAANTDGARVPRGTYTWKLTAEPRDGQGAPLTQTGTTTVD